MYELSSLVKAVWLPDPFHSQQVVPSTLYFQQKYDIHE